MRSLFLRFGRDFTGTLLTDVGCCCVAGVDPGMMLVRNCARSRALFRKLDDMSSWSYNVRLRLCSASASVVVLEIPPVHESRGQGVSPGLSHRCCRPRCQAGRHASVEAAKRQCAISQLGPPCKEVHACLRVKPCRGQSASKLSICCPSLP